MNKAAKKWIREWILPFGLEIIIVLLLIKFVFFFTVVPTGSMIPTIQEGGWLFSTRMYAPEKTVRRGDVVVFYNDELDKRLIKRTIGLPGDHVELDDEGKLYINGSLYPEPYVKNPDATSGEFTVPEGCYLFFGDNRANSLDARAWENPYIPANMLEGEARFVFWPLGDFGPLKR